MAATALMALIWTLADDPIVSPLQAVDIRTHTLVCLLPLARDALHLPACL